MHTRIASTVLLGLGILNVAVLNLLLAPRLAGVSAASPLAPPLQRDEALAAAPPARPAEPERALETGGQRAPAVAWATSVSRGAAGAARTGRAAPDIAFASDSALVRGLPASRALGRVLQGLARDPSREVLLRGHADPAGLPAYNFDLARRRADAVRQHLVKRGAPADRIVIEAVGAAEPLDPRPTRAAWARDRRVEVLWR
jgi:outer membrane protein OmpA-like peptidoglycan-associated protein